MDESVNNPYRWCVVETCKSTSIKTPEKLFIKVPSDTEKRQEWLKLARLSLSMSGSLFFCQDHFNLEKVLENYEEIKTMGSAAQVKIKETCLPERIAMKRKKKRKGHRFTKVKKHCHVSSNKIASENMSTDSQSSSVGMKRTGPASSYSVAKIRKTIKMENTVKVKSTRCVTCFSCDRNLYPLKETSFLSKFVSEIQFSEYDLICYECESLIKKMQIFIKRILEAQALFAEAINGIDMDDKHGLSRLKTTDIEIVAIDTYHYHTSIKNIINIRTEHNYMLPIEYEPVCNYTVVKREPIKIKNEPNNSGTQFENNVEVGVKVENESNDYLIAQDTRIKIELDQCQEKYENKLAKDIYDFENLNDKVTAEVDNELDKCEIKIENESDDGFETKWNERRNARITELNEEPLENEAKNHYLDIKNELYDEYDIIENELLQYENMLSKSELDDTVPVENELENCAETDQKDSARDVSNTEGVNREPIDYHEKLFERRSSCSSDEVTDSASEFEMEMDGAVFFTNVPMSATKENCSQLFRIKVQDRLGHLCPCASIDPHMNLPQPNTQVSCPDCNRPFENYKAYVTHQKFALKHILKDFPNISSPYCKDGVVITHLKAQSLRLIRQSKQ